MIDLIKGDCLKEMQHIPSSSIDLIVCDLPYGTTASNWDKQVPMGELWKNYNRILTPTGIVVLFANGMFTPRVMLSNLDDYKYRLVWVKRNSTNFVHAKNRPLVKSEDILVFSKGSMGHKSVLGNKRMTYNPQGIIKIDKQMRGGIKNFTGTLAGKRPSHTNVFVRTHTNYPVDVITEYAEVPPSKKLHTNEKPIPLLEYIVKTYSNENDTVLDNCMGSGTTGVACKLTNRDFIGIEIAEEYFEIAKHRIETTDMRGEE